MMSDKEIEIIENLLKPHFTCLEFGSGYSTAYFPRFVKRWDSVEDDLGWFGKVEKMIKNEELLKNAEINLNYREIKPSYYIFDYNLYDFILIDGKFRKECLELSVKNAKKEAIILLHDATRYEYFSWVNLYQHKILIEGEIPDENNEGYFLHRGVYQYEPK